MNNLKSVGILFIVGALGVLIPYTILTLTFNYPDVLRLDTGTILQNFQQGGTPLIFTWLAFGLLGFPLLIGYSILGKILEKKVSFAHWITTLGIISGVVQIIGLLRWVFIVPVLAKQYVSVADPSVQASIAVGFDVIHQFSGVLLGEFLGQLFTEIWTIGICIALMKTSYAPRWISWFGIVSALIYFCGQAELLATVIPGFPNISWASFLGSTLWLVWLMILGSNFLRRK